MIFITVTKENYLKNTTFAQISEKFADLLNQENNYLPTSKPN